MDTTASETTIFKSLAQMDHNGGYKLLEETTHFSCLEFNWSHRKSIHTALLPIFHLLKLVQLSNKHHLWKFKACVPQNIEYSTIVCSVVPSPSIRTSPSSSLLAVLLHGLHITAYIYIYINALLNFFTCIRAEPNPPTNLSATMTCDSQGYKVYIEWKVCHTESKSRTVIK